MRVRGSAQGAAVSGQKAEVGSQKAAVRGLRSELCVRLPVFESGSAGGWLVFLAFALCLVIFPPTASGQDIVVLKNGRKAECRILEFTADAVKIDFRPAPGAAPEFRVVPLTDVDWVEPAPLPGEAAARERAVKEGRSEPLLEFWAKRVAWLGRPRCDAGELGLLYAELLSRQPSADRLERALKVYQQIESGDWSPERRGRAQAGRLRILLRQGRTEEVRPLAEALLEKNGDPRVLIDLRHVLAETAAASLAQLEKDHPRWQEEDELVPRHGQLLNEALEGYLFPHLFYGTEEDLAARGLWAASQLSQAQNEPAQASDWAFDLTKLYPSSPECAAAAAFLAKQPVRPATAVAAAAETGESKDPDGNGAADEAENAEDTENAGASDSDDSAPVAVPEKPKRKPRAKKSPSKSKTASKVKKTRSPDGEAAENE